MKELIAMADHPIFQEGWEPKYRDVFVKAHEHLDGKISYGTENVVAFVNDTLTKGTSYSINGWANDFIHNVYSWNCNKKFYNKTNGHHWTIYLPSLQDLIDRLGDRFEELRKFGYISSDDIGMYAYCVQTDDGHEVAGHTPIEALMKAVAFVEAGLTWNNGRWE